MSSMDAGENGTFRRRHAAARCFGLVLRAADRTAGYVLLVILAAAIGLATILADDIAATHHDRRIARDAAAPAYRP